MAKKYECKNPKYTGVNQITLDYNHPVFGWIPFLACPEDVELHGREIYEMARNGEFGDVAPLDYQDRIRQEKKSVRRSRDALLEQLDSIVLHPLRWNSFSEEEKAEVGEYRQQLLDIPQQKGFPSGVQWPTLPECLKSK